MESHMEPNLLKGTYLRIRLNCCNDDLNEPSRLIATDIAGLCPAAYSMVQKCVKNSVPSYVLPVKGLGLGLGIGLRLGFTCSRVLPLGEELPAYTRFTKDLEEFDSLQTITFVVASSLSTEHGVRSVVFDLFDCNRPERRLSLELGLE